MVGVESERWFSDTLSLSLSATNNDAPVRGNDASARRNPQAEKYIVLCFHRSPTARSAALNATSITHAPETT